MLAERPDVEAIVRVARPFFEGHGRPVQVAVPEPLAAIDRDLAASGLQAVNPSLFMRRELRVEPAPLLPKDVRVDVDSVPRAEWLEAWAECAELGQSQDANFSIVRKAGRRARYVSLHDERGKPLAVGSWVCHGRWRCFGNLATRRDARGAGLGSLVLGVLAAQPAAGVEHDVLQVDRDGPAQRLYGKHGFRTALAYHYRREPQRLA